VQYGRTRWRRFGVLFGLSAATVGGLLTLMSNGALAASFAVSGQAFKVGADKLVATGFVQYGNPDVQADDGGGDPKLLPVAVAAMKTAELHNLCQSVVTPLGSFGNATLRITAGTGKKPVTATNMTIDMTTMKGEAKFENMEIGRDAASLDKGPTNDPQEVAQRRQGFFSQQADKVTITNLKQVAWSTTAGEFNLTGLSLSLSLDENECF
jgi:hypothetical protein